ncbi:Uncharacterised protein [Klebsiella pneumoniae]|nr:Uncharacterised protein [Klebsiella pneumoniae]
MRKFLIGFFIFFSGIAAGQSNLEDFNHSPKWVDSAGQINPDPGLMKYFQSMKFVCHNASGFTPEENKSAAKAFSELVQYTSEGDQIKGFWNSPEHKQKREGLLATAIKAGSWKAAYVNSVWAIKYPSAETPIEVASTKLHELVSRGIPIAAYKYASYLFGRDDETMYYLYAEAIKRGSPQAMSAVGGNYCCQGSGIAPIR